MDAVILAGGKGTRLRPLTVYTPKPIVPVCNRPFLIYQLEMLSKAGIGSVTLSLSYQPDKIESTLGDGSEHGVTVRYVTEASPLGTAGAYRFAAETMNGPTVVLNGDILTDVDLDQMIEFHRTNRSCATIALARVNDPQNYGLVETDGGSNVVRFSEKPKEAVPGIDTINAGIYILEPEVLSLVPKDRPASFEYDVFPAVLAKGMPFKYFVLEGSYWKDIGTPANYLAAHLDILAGKFRFERGESEAERETSPTAFIDAVSILGEGCVVKPNARISNSVLGPGVHVEEKAVIENSVIWPHCRISTLSQSDHAVIGRGCHIGRNSALRAGSVLGDKAVVPDYSIV